MLSGLMNTMIPRQPFVWKRQVLVAHVGAWNQRPPCLNFFVAWETKKKTFKITVVQITFNDGIRFNLPILALQMVA